MSTDFLSGSGKGQGRPTIGHRSEAGAPDSLIHDAPVNILIVDDEPKNLTVLETVLQNPGYRLVRAESADQALLALVVEEFALLILDIRMPGMSGFDLAQLIKERKKTARVPIIFLTAYYNEDQHVIEGYGTGAVDYLHKPVNAPILRSKVAVFVELYRANRESALANRALLAEVAERRRAEEQLRELNQTLDQRVVARSEALREREEQLRLFAEHAPAAIAMFDAKMRYLAGSQRWLTEHGFSGRDVRGRSYYEFCPELPERWKEIHHRCLAGAVEGAEEDCIERADGGIQWLRWEIRPWYAASGAVGGIIIFTEDITARKESEKALWKSNERFRKIFIYAVTGIAITDLQGRFQQCNPAYCELAGYSSEELEGMNFSALIHPDDLAGSVAAMQGLRDGQQSVYEMESRYLHKGGTAVWIHTFISLLRDDAGRPAHLVALVTDITGRRQNELALRAAKEAAEAANSSKDRFLAMLSHELRTPLTPALMVAETLQQDTRLTSEIREQIGIIKRNIDLEARLLDDLLDMTAISKGKLRLRSEFCDAHSLVMLAVQIVKDAALTKEIYLECELTAEPSGFWGDPPRFQQVLWNLLRNAVKFTPRGGRILTRTSHRTGEDGRPMLIVEVSDTGIGIDSAALERIFLPFEQEDPAGNYRFGGIGLGLTIARAIVELHGGRISARSDGQNRGATFMVELPGVAASAGRETVAPAISPASGEAPPVRPVTDKIAGPVHRILLVEDHSVTLETVSAMLRRWGYEVTTAATVADALKAASTQTFDLVVSDLGLPDGTGIQLMHQLRSAYGLRGIALSGYGMEEDILQSKAAGFVAHLVKPIHLADLRGLLTGLAGATTPIS